MEYKIVLQGYRLKIPDMDMIISLRTNERFENKHQYIVRIGLEKFIQHEITDAVILHHIEQAVHAMSTCRNSYTT